MDSSTSWIVAAGSCWVNIFSCVVFRSAAIVYVAIVTSLDTTRAEAAWPVTVMAILSCVAAPVAGWLATRIAVWKMTVSACLVAAVSISACFFADGIWYLVIFVGVLHGISLSFISLCHTVTRDHFTRYRALACGITFAGQTLSGLIFPPLLQFVLDRYGPKAMFLITGALMLNAAAGALLHRLPPDRPRKPRAILDEFKKSEMPLNEMSSHIRNPEERRDKRTGPVCSPEGEGLLKQDDFLRQNETIHQRTRVPQDVQEVVLSEARTTEEEGHFQQTESRDKECVTPYHVRTDVGDAHDTTTPTVCTKSEKSTSNSSKFTLPKYLRQPKFYIIAFASSVAIFNLSTYTTVVVDFATDRQVSKWNAVFLLFLFAVADFMSKLGSGWITDRGLILTKGSMMAANLFLSAASLCAMPFCYSFYLHAVQAVVAGWCSGALLVLTPVLLMELVDTAKFSECYGVTFLIGGILLLPRPLLIGYFRDTLGDYQGLFVLMGVVSAVSALGCLFLQKKPEKKAAV